jgi:hypothetical protein
MSQVAPVLHREPVQIEKRRPLTRRESLQLALDQDGRCDCGCGTKMDSVREGITDEHIIPLGLGGSNDLTNRRLFRTPCAKDKTKVDRWRMAKANRLIKKADPEQRKPSRLQGRKLSDNPNTRGFDGKVRPRRNSDHQGGA